MSSTLPKSIQAQIGSNEGASLISEERLKQIKSWVEKYKSLPDNFLRIEDPQQFVVNEQTNIPDTNRGTQVTAIGIRQGPLIDLIEISVVEAQLVKNYGLLKMDLYCHIRVGHLVCETQTCPNGAKNPKWDGVYQFNLHPGIDSFHLEIYDERQFSADEKIAWLHEPIPQEVFQGVTVERWFPLSGKSGVNKEGSILLVLSHKKVPNRGPPRSQQPVQVFVPGHHQSNILNQPTLLSMNPQIPAYVSPIPPPASMNMSPTPQIQAPQSSLTPMVPAPVSVEDVEQLSEMFPSISKSIIKSILQNHNNDKEAAISYLLSLS